MKNLGRVWALGVAPLLIWGCGGVASSQAPSAAGGKGESGATSRDAGPTSSAGAPANEAGPAPSCMVDATDFDQSCTTDTDCRAVVTGYVCGGAQCANAGINAKALQTYERAYPPRPPNTSNTVVSCDDHACCRAGRCAAGTECAPTDAGAPMVDASEPPDLHYTVLCGEDTGPSDAGSAIPGVSRWCNGLEACTPFNGGWECCLDKGPVQMCIAP